MAKFALKKEVTRRNHIDKTEINKPTTEFNLEDYQSLDPSFDNTNKTIKNSKRKEYTSLRIQRKTNFQVNALINILGMDSADELISYFINKKVTQLSKEEKTMFNMYVQMYQHRDKKKKEKK